jgi:HK97 family phage major capsid protein
MSTELKVALDELGTKFEAFKASHSRELDEIKNRGGVSAETKAMVDRHNAAITEQEEKIEQIQNAQRETEKLAARLATLGAGPRSDEDVKLRNRAAAFFARGRRDGTVPDITDEQLEVYKAYNSPKVWNQFLRGATLDQSGRPEDPEIRNAMTTGSDPEGGYAVPPDRTGHLVELIYETSPMRQYATLESTSRKEKTGYNDLDEAGGGFAGEKTAPTETTTPGLGLWRIPVVTLYAEPQASSDELEDAEFDVEGWLNQKVGSKLGRLEATSSVTGNGVTRLRGFLTYPSGTSWGQVQQVPTGQSAGFIAAPNGGDVFLTLLGNMKAGYLPNFAWYMNRTTVAAVRKLKDNNGYLWQPSFQAGVASLLAGYPVRNFEDMPAIGADTLAIAGADMKAAYTLVTRRGITVLRDPYTAKPMIKFYSTMRSGGAVVNFEAIKLIRFGT